MNLQMHLNWAVICRSVLYRHDDSARRFRLCQEFEHGLAARVGWGPCVQHNSNGRGVAGAAVSVSVFVERSAGYVGESSALPDGREHFRLYGEARAAAASTAMRSGASGQRHGARAGELANTILAGVCVYRILQSRAEHMYIVVHQCDIGWHILYGITGLVSSWVGGLMRVICRWAR